MATASSNQVLGHFQLEARIGGGAMGEVFRAHHIHLPRQGAVKVLKPELAVDLTFQERFRREAAAITKLTHPHIVEIFDYGTEGGQFYLVMEYVPDGSLRALLDQAGGQPLPLALGLDLMQQAAEGLAYAHDHGIIHRDIKPENLLLCRNPKLAPPASGSYVLKISDFGLVKLVDAPLLTQSSVVMGTPGYLAPEQCEGVGVDARTDIYALGVVLYEVMTGRRPFTARTISEAAYQYGHVTPTPPRQLNPQLPPVVEQIILDCLAKDRATRYATAGQVGAALQLVLEQLRAAPAAQPAVPPTVRAQASSTGQALTQIAAANSPANVPGPQASQPPSAPPVTVATIEVFDTQGQLSTQVPLPIAGLRVGRQPDSELRLDGEGVSRQHLQIGWNGREATLTDLGSTNGTLLGSVQLPSHVATLWDGTELVHIGEFWLRLAQPSASVPSKNPLKPLPAGFPSLRPPVRAPAAPTHIGITADVATLTLTPGQPAVVRLTLANLGTIVDHLDVTVEGVPCGWVQLPADPVQLNPGGQAIVLLTATVPRDPTGSAGSYTVVVRAVSRVPLGEQGTVTLQWTVESFAAYRVELSPATRYGKTGASYAVQLTNEGNAPAHYRLTGKDDAARLQYVFSPSLVPVAPGKTAAARLDVRALRRWIGRAEPQPFRVCIAPAEGGAAQEVQGQFMHQALIPWWVPMVVPALFAVLVALAAFWNVIFPPPTPIKVPNVVGKTVEEATETLNNAGLVVSEFRQEASNQYDKGLVTQTEPAVDIQLTRGSSVIVYLSSGPPPVTVPDTLVGRTYDAARAKLEKVGLKAERIDEPSNQPKGRVLRTKPAGGAQTAPNESITVYVSGGPQPLSDLVITELNISPTPIAQNVKTEVVVNVCNRGSNAAHGFNVQWRPYDNHPALSKNDLDLEDGKCQSVPFQFVYDIFGNFNTVASIDTSNNVGETAENNNELSRPITVYQTRVLKLFWNPQREDNITIARPESIEEQRITGGYQEIRTEGYVFADQVPGSIPLKLFWNPQREDNITIARPESIEEQKITGGYQEIRTEGYVFADQVPGSVPLKLFWSDKRRENITAAAPESIEGVMLTGGYREIRIEGYLYPATR
ncbi:MAG: protein kinase [Kouleothrix sp.]|nr:protein kinase [Kouleothrix sp.]